LIEKNVNTICLVEYWEWPQSLPRINIEADLRDRSLKPSLRPRPERQNLRLRLNYDLKAQTPVDRSCVLSLYKAQRICVCPHNFMISTKIKSCISSYRYSCILCSLHCLATTTQLGGSAKRTQPKVKPSRPHRL